MNKKFMFVIMTLIIAASIVLLPAIVPAALSMVVHGSNPASTAPMADFTATPITGPAPLQVSFTDGSTGNPTGWAWYFGDETYDKNWTQMTATADWDGRSRHTSVVLPDGGIVLMGGFDGSLRNDVWRSTDQGATWMEMTDAAPWTARNYHTSVALPDGNIVLMGGWNGSDLYNDVWRSTDQGETWTVMTSAAGWTARYALTSVALPNGNILVMGGYDGNYRNDVWRSIDQGETWTEMTDAAQWSIRCATSVALPDGSIVVMGGMGVSNSHNDVWRSTDQGETWTEMTDAAGWTARSVHSSVSLVDGSIVLMGGNSIGTEKNDVWRSTDQGATWTQMKYAGWKVRSHHTSVALPDGSILLMGGMDYTNFDYDLYNDVWRLKTAGSNEQHPTHSYTKPGTYSVALQVSNPDGVSSKRQDAFINVSASTPPPDPTPGPTPSPTLDPTAPRHIYLPLILQGLPTTLTPPDAPILNQINNVDGDGNYSVNWSASAGAETYSLQEATDLNFTDASTVYTGPNTSADIRGRQLGTYYYRVRAANTSGQSKWSNMQSVVVTVPFIPKEWNVFKIPGVGFSTSLALSSGGTPHIGLSLDKYIYYMHWDGDKWASETIDTLTISSAGLDINASLAISQTDQPQIAYAFYNPAQIGYASWDGTMWQKSYLTGMIPYHVNLALKADDDPCISYLNYGLGGDWSIYFNCRTGSSWGMSRFVDNVTWGVRKPNSQSHSLALTTDGIPHISYYRGRNDSEARLYHATLIGGSWENTAVDGQGTGSFSSLALDSQNYPHISYHNHENGTLKYARWNGSQWQVETVDSTGIVDQHMGQLTSLALDKNDHPHISYIDVINHNLKYAYWDGSQWNIEIIDDSGLLWRWISLALDNSGFAHISYVTLDGNKLGLMYATNSSFSGE